MPENNSQSSKPLSQTFIRSHPDGIIPWVLIGTAILLVIGLLVLPVGLVLWQAISSGWNTCLDTLSHTETISAVKLSLLAVLVALIMNVVFGIACAWLLVMYRFPGRKLLDIIISLPLFVSPVVAGLMMVLLFGRGTLFGDWLGTYNIQVIFHVTGVVLVTVFVTCPYIVREIIPILEAYGREREESALVLGANGWSLFWRITLPKISPGLFSGILLSNARALGEFGAASVVSGHIRGETLTLPLQIEQLYNEYNAAGAFIVATLLVVMALTTLIVKALFDLQAHSV